MLNVKLLLAKVAKTFTTNPEIFTTTTLARDNRGTSTQVTDPNACQFCTMGLFLKFAIEEDPSLKKRIGQHDFGLFQELSGLDYYVTYCVNDSNGRLAAIDYLKEKANAIA